MTDTIDRIVMDTSKHSNSHTMQRSNTTYYQTRKLIEYLDRKRKMINLKVAVEDALSKLSKTDRRILGLVFIDGVKSELIAQFLGVSLRTFFRKKVMALSRFNIQMIASGFNLEYFIKEYGREKWIVSVYEECVSKYNKEDEIMDNLFVKRVLNEISQVNLIDMPYMC